MITPEPLIAYGGERYDYPSDEGLQSRFLRYFVTVEDGMGAAGHLGVVEEVCVPEAHDQPGIATLGGIPCDFCGAAV